MASDTLPVFSRPYFAQVLDQALASEVRSILISEAVALQLSVCSFEDENGYPCGQLATIHDVQTELDYCAKHWRVTR